MPHRQCAVTTDVERAARVLRDGGLVAFGTETVYGLGVNALNEHAVARIFEAKNRPHFDPLIVHIADEAWLPELVTDVPEAARKLAKAFWPGPLTMVLPKTDRVPDLVTSGLPSVAIRMPGHDQARRLLQLADLPVAAPSANPFGQVSPTTAEHVVEQLGDRIDLVLDGGPCRVGVESTVILLDAVRPRILRHGGLTQEQIESVIGEVAVPDRPSQPASPVAAAPGAASPGAAPQQTPDRGDASRRDADANVPASPGMLPQHYAPRTPLILADAIDADEIDAVTETAGRRLGAIALSESRVTDWLAEKTEKPEHTETTQAAPKTEQSRKTAERRLDEFAATEFLTDDGDLRTAAARFFAALRRLDAQQLDLIVAWPFPDEGLGRALNDRLRRACHR